MISLSIMGDVWLPKEFFSKIRIEGEYIFNLESPITKGLKPTPEKINLKAEENYICKTFGKNPIAVCIGNNHIMDYGLQGFRDTIMHLELNHIRYFGCGAIENNCNNPGNIKINGLNIALFGYVCPTTNPIYATNFGYGVMYNNLEKIKQDIIDARSSKTDRVIVFIHWGAEEVYHPKPEDISIARSIIDAGADLIIGHHAHLIQPMEKYKGKYIFYGLGNCLMPDIHLPCYYDDKGNPTRVYKKLQKNWNKYSLLVKYVPGPESVDVSKMYFTGRELIQIPFNSRKIYLKNINIDGYAKQFKYSMVWGHLKFAAANFLISPKIPNSKFIKSFFNIVKSYI